jgi:hypothetical protein
MSLDDISKLLKRGGEATQAEIDQLTRDATEAKVQEFNHAITKGTIDRPVKVVTLDNSTPPITIKGYITQERFILNRTPEELARILGLRVAIDLKPGARIMGVAEQLKVTDFENRGYTHWVGGKPRPPESKPKAKDPNRYEPGDGAGQWELIREVKAAKILDLRPGEPYDRMKRG